MICKVQEPTHAIAWTVKQAGASAFMHDCMIAVQLHHEAAVQLHNHPCSCQCPGAPRHVLLNGSQLGLQGMGRLMWLKRLQQTRHLPKRTHLSGASLMGRGPSQPLQQPRQAAEKPLAGWTLSCR